MIENIWTQLLEFTAQFVVPDWGQLVALLPVFLAIPVIGYILWLVYRLATAGPTRRGKQRLPPATPAGIHMPGPSFAPVIGAIGLFFVVFGMVAGGLWLLVGVVILVIALLYWGREALREYDSVRRGEGQAVVVGMLPAPAGTPPEGVHIPPPSFRPFLVAASMTMLVAGMVIGGWALAFGVVAIVITLLGWLWDSRKEYRAVEAADETGHLDMGGAPPWPKATFAVLGVLVAVTLLLTSGILPNSGEAVPSAAPGGGTAGQGGGGAAGQGGGGAAASAPPSAAPLPAADVVVAAENIAFVDTNVTAPAGKPFTIAFDNRDNAPHDIVIKDAGGATLFQGEIVNGPKVVVYDVPALPAGSYPFVCSVHPNMTGTITAQ